MSRKVMAAILAHREVARLLSDQHVWLYDTLLKACVSIWASMKNYPPKARAGPPDDGIVGESPRPDCSGRSDPGPLSANCCAIACRAMDDQAARKAALDMGHRHSRALTRRLSDAADKG
jgi:hypothetical protein